MNSESVPCHGPDVIWRTMDDGAVLVSPAHGSVRVLNAVGSEIWRLIDGKNSLRHIEKALTEKYRVAPEEARKDLHAFVQELTNRHLIQWDDGDQGPGEAA